MNIEGNEVSRRIMQLIGACKAMHEIERGDVIVPTGFKKTPENMMPHITEFLGRMAAASKQVYEAVDKLEKAFK